LKPEPNQAVMLYLAFRQWCSLFFHFS
jgi:hypothetical protein